MDIKKRIKENGFTISKVAELMNVSQPALTKLLNGNPTINKLQEIANIIGVSLADLVADDGNIVSIVCPHCGSVIELSVRESNPDKQDK